MKFTTAIASIFSLSQASPATLVLLEPTSCDMEELVHMDGYSECATDNECKGDRYCIQFEGSDHKQCHGEAKCEPIDILQRKVDALERDNFYLKNVEIYQMRINFEAEVYDLERDITDLTNQVSEMKSALEYITQAFLENN